MRDRYKVINPSGTFFVTSTIVNWINIFTTDKYFMILIDALKFYQRNNGLLIHCYVIMNNHFHLIISHKDISKIMQSFKKYTATRIISELELDNNKLILSKLKDQKATHKITSKHQVWQEGFHPQEISTPEMLRQKMEYIHYNPVRKGLVSNPVEWKFSSAIDYLTEEKGLIEIYKLY